MSRRDMRIDLHVHSNNSDGAQPPAEVVRAARDAGVDVFALTDHDSLAGIPEARSAAASLGIEVIGGCEISATFERQPVHILGYFMDLGHPRLNRELAAIRDSRLNRARRMVERLNDLGVAITYERVREIASGESVGRPHIAQAMVEAGAVATTDAAFTDAWIGNDGRAYVEKTALEPQATVDLIREAGGAAVLAHPVWLKRRTTDPAELIRALAAGGLAGIEVDHPDHDSVARGRFAAFADEYDLVPTGSSDYHGNRHGGAIGSNTTTPANLERLRSRAKATG